MRRREDACARMVLLAQSDLRALVAVDGAVLSMAAPARMGGATMTMTNDLERVFWIQEVA